MERVSMLSGQRWKGLSEEDGLPAFPNGLTPFGRSVSCSDYVKSNRGHVI